MRKLNWFCKTCPSGSVARMVIENTYPNLSNIVHTDFELDRVIQSLQPILESLYSIIEGIHHRPAVEYVAGSLAE